MAQPALRDWVGDELAPGADIFGDALIPIIRQVASPFFHPVSTCRMGRTDAADAVLDPRCRVSGIAGLRVVDASIFRSDERRVGKGCVSKCRFRWSPYH